jgi:hypothetical protein
VASEIDLMNYRRKWKKKSKKESNYRFSEKITA